MMWGAKVKTPVDMPDNILKDSISKTKEVVAGNTHVDNDGKNIVIAVASFLFSFFS